MGKSDRPKQLSEIEERYYVMVDAKDERVKKLSDKVNSDRYARKSRRTKKRQEMVAHNTAQMKKRFVSKCKSKRANDNHASPVRNLPTPKWLMDNGYDPLMHPAMTGYVDLVNRGKESKREE